MKKVEKNNLLSQNNSTVGRTFFHVFARATVDWFFNIIFKICTQRKQKISAKNSLKVASIKNIRATLGYYPLVVRIFAF